MEGVLIRLYRLALALRRIRHFSLFSSRSVYVTNYFQLLTHN